MLEISQLYSESASPPATLRAATHNRTPGVIRGRPRYSHGLRLFPLPTLFGLVSGALEKNLGFRKKLFHSVPTTVLRNAILDPSSIIISTVPP